MAPEEEKGFTDWIFQPGSVQVSHVAPEQPHKCPNSWEGLKQKKTEPLGGEELPSLSQLFPWEPEPKMMLANDVGE